VAHALRERKRPLQRLHRAEAPADHRGEALDAEMVCKPRLRCHPVLHRDNREIRAPGFSRRGVDGSGAGRAEARADVVVADDEEAVGVERLAGAYEVVPPADVLGRIRVAAGDVVRGVERVAHQHGVGARRIQRAVGLVGDVELRQHRAALQLERLGEARLLCLDDPDGPRVLRRVQSVSRKRKTRSACARTGFRSL
jgi:hypothetical protein